MRSNLFLLALFFGLGIKVFAEPPKGHTRHFQNARIFLPLTGASGTAGYASVTNDSDKPVSLSVLRAEAFKAAEIHQSVEKDGRMSMEKMNTILIPAHGSFKFEPGGYHIMLMDATRALKEGESLRVTFSSGGQRVEAKFKIVPRETAPSSSAH